MGYSIRIYGLLIVNEDINTTTNYIILVHNNYRTFYKHIYYYIAQTILTFTTTTPPTVNPGYSIMISWLTTTISRFIHYAFTGYPLHMRILIPSPPTLYLPIAIVEHFTNTSVSYTHLRAHETDS